jgi:hypothetical protein
VRPYLKNKQQKWAGGVVQVVEQFLSKCKVQGCEFTLQYHWKKKEELPEATYFS